MKHLYRLSPITLAALTLFGCDQIPEPIEPGEPGVEGLSATYVGGHLGSYGDCAEEAWENVGTDRPEADGARAEPDADCDGDCGRLNCEAARLTFELRNESDISAERVEAIALFVLGRDGLELVELPISTTLDSEGQPFDGNLDPGGQILLHVEFAGPLNVLDIVGPPPADDADGDFAWQSGAQLRLLVGAATHEETSLDTPELYSLPEVDT